MTEILSRDRWIVDGNYLHTLELRLQACDTVFMLDYPLSVCLEGAASRIGVPREDMPWVEQTFDPEFRQWIEDFSRDQRPEICRLLEAFHGEKRIIWFCARKEADIWLTATAPLFF